MPDNPRIDELRRRVLADPASIAFAALAEEYRRAGEYANAIETCRAGLQRHPSYLSARVTLGRSLIEVGEYDSARVELETVLKSAPENLAAIRAMAELHDRFAHHGHDTADDLLAAPAAPAAETPAPISVPAAPPRPIDVSTLRPADAAPVQLVDPDVQRLEAFLAAISAVRASALR